MFLTSKWPTRSSRPLCLLLNSRSFWDKCTKRLQKYHQHYRVEVHIYVPLVPSNPKIQFVSPYDYYFTETTASRRASEWGMLHLERHIGPFLGLWRRAGGLCPRLSPEVVLWLPNPVKKGVQDSYRCIMSLSPGTKHANGVPFLMVRPVFHPF